VNSLEVVLDTSVLVKWFHDDDGLEITESRAIRDAHRHRLLTVHILDLTLYELGNVLVRRAQWPASRIADQLDDLLVICGPTHVPAPAWRRDAAELAVEHRLSFYDASFAAAARALSATLVCADKKVLKAGLGTSATDFVAEHGDHIRKTP
jgi:predicted nucleic acid-binding protein